MKVVSSFTRQLEDFSSGILAVEAFPMSLPPFEEARLWPAERRQPLMLGFAFTQSERSVLTLPEGMALVGTYDWQQESPVGTVRFSAKQDGQTVVSERRIVLAQASFTAQQELLVKQYLAWVEAAYGERLAIAKKEKP